MKITIKKIFWYLLCFLPFADSLNGYLNGGGNEGGLSGFGEDQPGLPRRFDSEESRNREGDPNFKLFFVYNETGTIVSGRIVYIENKHTTTRPAIGSISERDFIPKLGRSTLVL